MFKNLSIGKKIGLGFGLVLLFLCGVGVTGYLGMSTARGSIDTIVQQLDITKEVNSVLSKAQDAQAGSLRMILYDDDQYREVIHNECNNALDHATKVRDLLAAKETKDRADEVINKINSYLAANDQWYELQLQRRETGKIRAQAAEVVMHNIGNLITAQQEAIIAGKKDLEGKSIVDFDTVAQTTKARQVQNAFNNVRYWSQKYQLVSTPQAQEEIATEWRNDLAKTTQALTECKELVSDQETQKVLDDCLAAVATYSEQVDAFCQITAKQRDVQINGQKASAEALMAQSVNVRDGVYDVIDKTREQANSDVASASFQITAISFVAVLAGIIGAIIITRIITKPIINTVEMLKDIAQGEGDLTKHLDESSGDELGQMAKWFNTFVEKLRGIITDIAGNAMTLTGAATELASTSSNMAASSEQMSQQSTTVAAAAEEMSTNMNNMSASTEEMSSNVKTVAAAIEEMTASISEVAKNAEQAASVAADATRLADTSNQRIGELGTAADEIGKVIEVIQDIAEQTNLLALNATIEAARAGEAGKGFAVVATEVKELAKQTADATDDIRKRIEGIQGSTGEAVTSIADISDVINKVNEVSRTIASAVEQQSSTTQEISRSITETATAAETVSQGVSESASASSEITTTIVGVDEGAKLTSQGAGETQTASRELSQLAESLQSLVSQFKTK